MNQEIFNLSDVIRKFEGKIVRIHLRNNHFAVGYAKVVSVDLILLERAMDRSELYIMRDAVMAIEDADVEYKENSL